MINITQGQKLPPSFERGRILLYIVLLFITIYI